MRVIEVAGSRPSRIVVGERLEAVRRYLPPGARVVVVTDENVAAAHRDRFPDAPLLRIGTGEGAKTLDTVRELYHRLMGLEADRSTFLLGIGGGVVCDVAGYVASTFLRGLRFGFAATTLLAQVDASVGGKNGVNLEGYKNIVGTFNQPEFVLCDPEVLRTLPAAELVNGMAEIVKHALIADADLMGYLETHAAGALALDPAVIETLVCESVAIKAAVVGRDEREQGERRKLNFGHTLGHAVERTLGVAHGAAVSVGMAFAAALSVRKGLLSAEEHERILRLMRALRLPGSAAVDCERLKEAVGRDKKRAAAQVHFVLLEGIGRAVVADIPLTELREMIGSFPGIVGTEGAGEAV
jgi:3-dehydroquinate synthase